MSSDQSEIPNLVSLGTDQEVKTLEADILHFTNTLSYWGKYLSEIILSGADITEEQFGTAYQYFLEDAGLLVPFERREEINIICKSNIGTYKTDLELTKISDVEGINALIGGQMLELSSNLTIVYGSNGSGKSGYIRLFNNVFITKGEKTILPNINESVPVDKKAQFEFSNAGTKFILNYPQDCTRSEFKQFSVFDENAVHAHLNNKNQFEFKPSGLTYFGYLIESFKKMEELVSTDINKREQGINLSALFDGESIIKTLINELSAKTKIEKLNDYKGISEEERINRIRLEEKKAGLIALKKDKEISDLLQQRQQLTNLKNNLSNINRYFSNDQLIKATVNIKDCIAKEHLAATENIEKFKIDYLKAVGSSAWRDFILAADTFARLQDNEHKEYPEVGDICLLCQQPLSSESIQLVKAYWGFIKSKAEQEYKEVQISLENSKSALIKLDLNLLSDTSTLYKWLLENRAEDLGKILETIKEFAILRNELVHCLNTKKFGILKAVQSDTSVIENIIQILDQKVKDLQDSDLSKQIDEIQKEITFLNHKEKLNDHFDKIERSHNNLNWVAKAQKEKGKINKREATNKEKELSGIYFNQTYIDKFNQECQRLNGDFGISISHTASSGTSYRQLNLKGKHPSDILSEGEQKVISLADFLSETILSGINRGMIFDDPVTSLDEERKAQIAERLADESISRQIVVFTHDLVFVSQLIGICQDSGKPHICHWIEQRNGKPGYISLRNSPSYEKEYKSAEKPTNLYLQARKDDCPATTREMLIQQGFTSLRTCYETLVVFGFFQGVVQRFVERVSVESLKTVNIDQETKNELMDNFGLCCRYMEGHSHSDRYAYKKPKLEDLDVEIKRFEALRLKIAAFNKATAKR